MNQLITIFKDVRSDEPFYVEIKEEFNRIINGNSKILINQIRTEQDKEKRSALKEKLPSVCFSGVFKWDGNPCNGKFKNRRDNQLVAHSSYVVIDFDHVQNIHELKKEIFKIPFIMASWISPSGDGIKALAKIKFPEKHREHYKSLLQYFEKYEVTADEKNVNPSRVCYESFDPDLLQKEENEVADYSDVIEPKVYQAKPMPYSPNHSLQTDEDKTYAKLKKWIENKGEMFVDGNRNNFLMKLASACNRTGISKDSTLTFLADDFLHGTDFSVKELQSVIKSVFDNYAHQFGVAKFQNNSIIDFKTKEVLDEKTFDCELPIKDLIYFKDVYGNLEERLKNGVSKGETTHYPLLDNHFRWMRREITIIHGYGNVGKTACALSLMLLKSIFCNYKWAIFNPENSPADFFYQDILEMFIGKPLDKKFPNCATDEEREAGKEFINEHFFYIYPKDDSPTPDYVLKRFMEVIIKHKVDGVLIDPYNQLIHDRQGNRDDLYLELFLNKVKRFAQNQDIFFIICAHPVKPQRLGSTKMYDEPSQYDLAGGAMWDNKSDNILCYHRPNFFTDPKDTWCTLTSQKIKKQKLNGLPGKVHFFFERFKSRYFELSGEPTGSEVGYNPLEVPFKRVGYEEKTHEENVPRPSAPMRNYYEPIKADEDELGF